MFRPHRAMSVSAGCEHVFVLGASDWERQGSILHADLDAFFASVEQRDDPALRGRPVIVGGGIAMAASYEAKAKGVRAAMGERVWRALCPEAIVVPARLTAYSQASRDVFEVLRDITPVVEPLSIDEAFLDVSGLTRSYDSPAQVAQRVRAEVRRRVGLPISVGVARTKFLAKIASAHCKPDGLLVVPTDEAAFLHPLPIERLWGVGKVTAQKLHDRGIRTIGQLAALDERVLTEGLGPAAGRHLHAVANLRDPRPVRTGHRRRSIGSQSAFGARPHTEAEIDEILTRLVDRVTHRLRNNGLRARTVTVRLRYGDFSRATRSRTLPGATDATGPILAAARTLMYDVWGHAVDRGLTLVGITLSGLDPVGTEQLLLPFDDVRREQHLVSLEGAIDEVRQRFGTTAVTRARMLDQDVGAQTPVLPLDPADPVNRTAAEEGSTGDRWGG